MDHGPPRRILVIDDDPDFVDFVTIVLQSAGHTVIAATNAAGGMEAMRAQPPDLVIADVMMSRSMDGLQIDHRMAQDPLLRDIPLLMVSAIASDRDVRIWSIPETQRFAGFMRKPLEPAALLQRVAAAASGRHQGGTDGQS